MDDKNILLRKSTVIVIILLFFGMSVVSSTGNIVKKITVNNNLDTFDISEELLNRDIICYGYCVNDPSGQLVEGPIYFSLNDPGNISQIWGTSSSAPMVGGAWTWGGWYCSEYANGKLWRIDFDSGYMVEIGGGGVHLNDLAWVDVGEIHGATNTSLYEVNEYSGEQTFIGSFGLPEGNKMGGIAFDFVQQRLFGVEYVNNGLYEIDTDTGETEYIGSLGIDIDGNAVLDYCIDNDCLYLSTFTDQGELYKINKETGECTLVGGFRGGAEISALIINPDRVYLPTADFIWSPRCILPSETVEFNASSSYTGYDEIILYEWDWNNDLIFDESSESPLTEYMWEETGYYPVTLLVHDNHNYTDTQQYIVYVGNIFYVGGTGPDNYTKIQDAIDNSSEGDTVFVFNGTYYENVVVDKSINLIGENRNTTIIDGGNISDTVCVNSDLVKINEFTIQNSGKDYFCEGIEIHSNYTTLLNNTITNNRYGITLWSSSSDNTIKGNNISNNYWPGIISWSSNNNNIINNTFSNNGYSICLYTSHNNIIIGNIFSNEDSGISIYDGSRNNNVTDNNIKSNNWYGILFSDSGNNNIISGNNISNNYRYGIYLYSSNINTIINNSIISNNWSGMEFIYSDGNNITGNNILNNGNEYEWKSGIRLRYSSRNNITENNIISNNGYGIDSAEYGSNNRIYHNNFINNSWNAIDYDSNTWDDGYPSGGNYWDDYTGNDSNGDGIGDIPYDIYPCEEDRYPFMNPNGWNNTRPNKPVITGPTNGRKGIWYEYNFSISDPNGDSLWIHIDWEHGTPSKWDGPFPSGSIIKYNYSWRKKGSYTIRAQTMDSEGLLSPWGTLEVTIPKTRFSTSWYHLFLNRFSFFERIISWLMNL